MTEKTTAPRTEGKFKNCISTEHFWEYYKSRRTPACSESDFRKICEEFNQRMVDYLVEEAGEFNMFGCGRMRITKYRRKKLRRKVDYNTTRILREEDPELIAYYTDRTSYSYRWEKWRSVLENKETYSFIACREARRKPWRARRNNPNIDYFER